MNNNEFLKIIKRKGVGTINGLPSGYDYSVSDKTLTLKLTKGVCDNMQNDSSAFESWALVLKFYCPQLISKVIIDWEDPKDSNNQHFNRFIYRLTRFVQNYEWADAAKHIPPMPALLYCSAPNDNTKGKDHYSSGSEDWLECDFVERKRTDYDAIDHQFPVGLFDGKAADETQFTPAGNSQIDIWGVREEEFTIFELKKPGNKRLGIISELMFYTNVVCDLLHHNIFIDKNRAERAIQNKFRGFDTFYDIYSGVKSVSKIRAVFLAEEFHTLFNDGVLELINQSIRLKRYNITFEKEQP